MNTQVYCRNQSSLILSFTMVARLFSFTINDQGLATFNACQVYKVLPPRHGHLSCFPWFLMNTGLFRFHHCDICIGWYHIYAACIYLYYMCIYKIYDMIMLLIFTVFCYTLKPFVFFWDWNPSNQLCKGPQVPIYNKAMYRGCDTLILRLHPWKIDAWKTIWLPFGASWANFQGLFSVRVSTSPCHVRWNLGNRNYWKPSKMPPSTWRLVVVRTQRVRRHPAHPGPPKT